MNKVWIITDTENGWDCIVCAHTSFDRLKSYHNIPVEYNLAEAEDFLRKKDKRMYIIHEVKLL